MKPDPQAPRPGGGPSWAFPVALIVAVASLGAGSPPDRPRPPGPSLLANRPIPPVGLEVKKDPAKPPSQAAASNPQAAQSPKPGATTAQPPSTGNTLAPDAPQVVQSVKTVGLFALISLAPAAVLMVTAFVRINIVLILLRQALGSPQVPGNQVLTALAVLLTALVMRPVGETVYTRAIEPYANNRITWVEAYQAGSRPVKAFMLAQIERTNHSSYLWKLYDEVVPPTPGRDDPVYGDDFPMRVVAPAFLLSEITTALVIGFYLYLPFLVIDLVVSAVLAAMGLFMLPPSLVALPLKLILFVMADGWLHVATMLLQSFGPVPP
jgi:flagellar biosynthetic protein FliP